jgi:hypothetical protein
MGAPGGKGGQAYGVNPFENAAQGMSQAFNSLNSAQSANANLPQNSVYNSAQQQQVGPISGAMGAYRNPYEQQVVNTATNDINRLNQIQQTQNAGAASRAGAFGGARHGLVEAQTNEASQRTLADMTSNLRQQGFNQAGQFAAQDLGNQLGVNAANQAASNTARQFNAGQMGQLGQQQIQNLLNTAQGFGGLSQGSFGLGQQVQAGQAGAGSAVQGLNQGILDAGNAQFNQYASNPMDMLSQRLQALGMNPLVNQSSTKNTQSPGSGQILGNYFQAAASPFSFSEIDLGF